ncbi:hypothetical protein KRR38_14885 [Novosphingobium sp. G106]|uniref:hypothetical protein n=1 Tax=Novosphingobium sp. G106 TaxID=2849500 RepID=UPI001C2D4773|nr:hypothetical protein [Novosphingobium sp. G106]MBV1688921.1 hypothetical protein [Novosphingobium sp. G106]
MSAGNDHPRSALAAEQQRLTEERALAAFNSTEVQAAITRVIAHFRADRNAAYEDQDELIQQSAREHLFHACLMAASETPLRPRFVWTLCHDHEWMGMKVPGSRFGQDNSDNGYRLAYIDGNRRYNITGRFLDAAPVDWSICVIPAQVGENLFADTLGFIGRESVDVAPDGSFQILCDATPTEGRRNHLCVKDGKILNVRDTLGDWACERPCLLDIEPIDDAPQDSFDADRAKTRAAELGETIARFFLEHLQHGYFESGPINSMNTPWSAGSAGGLLTQASSLGHYGLAQDEAMIITADPMGAPYVGMQITDIWMLSYEYRTHTSSLNHAQAKQSGDGLFRWVISGRDPGVYNWLDGSGQRRGTILLRWQHLPGNVIPGLDKLQTEVVKISELKDKLPADTVWVDSHARRAQQAQRKRDYDKRVE